MSCLLSNTSKSLECWLRLGMWFCTSGTNAFDKLGIWEFGNLEGGRGGRGRRGGEIWNEQGGRQVEPVQLSVLLSNFFKVIFGI